MWSSQIFSKCHKILIFASHPPLIMFWPFIICFQDIWLDFFSVSPSTMPHLRPFQIRSDSLWNGLLSLKNIEIFPFVSASGLHFASGLEWHHSSRLHFLCVSAEGHSVWKFRSSSFRTTVFSRSFTLRLISF